MKRFTAIIGLLLLMPLLSGCTTDTQKPVELRVFAAISLTDALHEIGTRFTADSRIQVYYNFAASTTLQRQLEKGAAADIFISASPHQIVALEGLQLLETGSRRNLLTNRLVLVSHETAQITVETPETLASPHISRIAIGQPNIVPAGTYAQETLTSFGLWDALQPKLIFGTDVRATLAYVAAGNVDVAIVYETDVTLAKNIKTLYQFPPETYTPIVYPAVIMKRSPQKPAAQRFMAYLKVPESRKIFEKHGFTYLSVK